MDYALICLVALLASGLTFFSGFGLGTLLLPAFALFFPPAVAVGLTALVHFASSLFKLALMGRHANRGVVLRFGLPALAASLTGAWLLTRLAGLPVLATWTLGDAPHHITLLKLVLAVLMLAFALEEVLPFSGRVRLDRRHLPLGGLLSGFLGGLSGHQGALRSAFLVRAGLSKEAFVGTGSVISGMVDLSRLGVYAWGFWLTGQHGIPAGKVPLVVAAALCAFVGALLGKRLLRKVEIRTIRRIVAVLLVTVALGLGTGLL